MARLEPGAAARGPQAPALDAASSRNQLLAFVGLTFAISWAIWWGMALTSLSSAAIGAFVVWTIGLSILFTWLFNETRGSLIVVMLFHASINLGAFVPAAVGSIGAVSFLYAIVTWIVALVVVARFGKATLASARSLVGH
jgi:hypothetical protein